MATKKQIIKPEKPDLSKFPITSLEGQYLTPEDRLDTQNGYDTYKYSCLYKNPIAKSAIDTIVSSVFWSNRGIKSNPLNDYRNNPQFEELDNEIIPFVERCLHHIGNINKAPNVQYTPTFDEWLKISLTDAKVFGFTISEMKWNKSENNYFYIEKLKPKPPWNYDIIVDEYDEIKQIDYNGPYGQNTLDVSRYLIKPYPYLRHGNYYGVSDLQAVQTEIEALELLEKLVVKGVDSSALLPILVHIESSRMTEKELNKIITAIQTAKAGGFAVVPKGLDEQLKSTKMIELETYPDRGSQYVIELANNIMSELIKRITRTLGVQDDLGQTSVGTGSYAKSLVEFDVTESKAEQGQQWVCEFANRVVNSLIYYNFNNLPETYHNPIFDFSSIEEKYDTEKIKYYTELIKAGIANPDEAFIREELRLPPREQELFENDEPNKPMELENDNY